MNNQASAEMAWNTFLKDHRVSYEWVAAVKAGFIEGFYSGQEMLRDELANCQAFCAILERRLTEAGK